MRIVWTLAFSFLIWPVSVMAQNPSPPSQSDPQTQNPPTTNDLMPGSNTTAVPPPPEPVLPAPLQPAAFLRLSPIKQPPIAPAYASIFNLSAGYSVTSLGTPSLGRAVLTGADVNIAADAGRRFGAKLDLGYARAGNAFSTGRRMDALTYLLGPVVSIWNGDRLDVHAQALAGGARVVGSFVNASGGLSTGRVHYPAWAFGGGVEYRLSYAFGFRVNVDYMHTHFFNSSRTIGGQNDVRVMNSIIYYIGQPIKHRPRPLE